VYNITKTELAHRGGGAGKGVFQFCTDVSDVIYFVPSYAHEKVYDNNCIRIRDKNGSR